ncbi:hypothetical protein [Giesbergeria anulus]|uniref:Uncharacterized protein n=1 Tax=Giesbergeria anulus TaxID=180197 RepID=A0A1H9R4C0_9BURK|nr:hypothetical protein [Giesbergeria anulus]SER67574.1 hypothetical protein SAMN02982919_02797 [Giesbergeria anulus]
MSAPSSADSSAQLEHQWLPWLARIAAILALLAVFALYTQPDFMVLLANQVWSCF